MADWYTKGILTNPLVNTILADSTDSAPLGTGPMATPCDCGYLIIVSSTVQAVIILELRDGTNTSTVLSHAYIINANTTFALHQPYPQHIDAGGRWRLRLNAAITGSIQGSLHTD